MAPSQSARPITVLCVDDEPTIVETLRMILQLQGFSVFTAQSAEQAKSIAAENAIDVALVDYSVCLRDRVCVREMLPGVRCLLHSGNPELAERPDCLSHVIVIAKPVHPQKLISIIREQVA